MTAVIDSTLYFIYSLLNRSAASHLLLIHINQKNLFFRHLMSILLRFFAQQINSDCLSLSFLTGTRHGVMFDWPTLKLFVQVCARMQVCGHQFLCSVFVVDFADKTNETARQLILVVACWENISKSQSNCCFDGAQHIYCQFDANVSMWMARNRHENAIFVFSSVRFKYAIAKWQPQQMRGQIAKIVKLFIFLRKKACVFTIFIVNCNLFVTVYGHIFLMAIKQ